LPVLSEARVNKSIISTNEAVAMLRKMAATKVTR
jgi:hypothetical protein